MRLGEGRRRGHRGKRKQENRFQIQNSRWQKVPMNRTHGKNRDGCASREQRGNYIERRFRQLMLVNHAAVLADLRVAHLVMNLLGARLPEFPAIAPRLLAAGIEVSSFDQTKGQCCADEAIPQRIRSIGIVC
jgi:hypothetical protein